MKTIPVTQSSMPPFEEYCEEIRELWNSRWLTNMGTKHEQFQEQLKHYLQVPEITLTANGHLALELVLSALHLTGEVITTPFTFASTTHAIVRSGLTPVFCDVDPKTCTMDVSRIAALITEKTSCILPVHVYGSICDTEAINTLAKEHELKVVYDAAHAFGECYKGKPVGCFGDASIFSFHATKVFHTIEGGAVCCFDPSLSQAMDDLKNFGIRDEETVVATGSNAKMNEFQAAMGICNLRLIDQEIDKRRQIVNRYLELLRAVPGIVCRTIQTEVESNYAYFPIFVQDAYGESRDTLKLRLQRHGIYSRSYFYPITNEFDCYRTLAARSRTPVALDLSKRVLCLPLYADLRLEEVDLICSLIASHVS